eukprot:2362019-Prymnesium_polylepis.1
MKKRSVTTRPILWDMVVPGQAPGAPSRKLSGPRRGRQVSSQLTASNPPRRALSGCCARWKAQP